MLNQYPDFNNYLVFIFTKVTTEAESTRAIAGLILKNNVKLYYNNFPEEIRSFIHQHSMLAIDDASPLIRATAGTLISTIAMRGGLANWPSLLPTLCQYIDSSQYFTCEVRATFSSPSVVYLPCLFRVHLVLCTKYVKIVQINLSQKS